MNIKMKTAVAAPLAGLLALTVAGCGGGAGASGNDEQLSVVGFSVMEQANRKVFGDFTKTAEGKGVTFQTSYGSSGDQSRAVEGGLPADEVHFSLEPDMTRLVDDGLVAKSWKSGPTHGIATQSVVAMVVRKGNPKHINGWDDLTRPDVKIVTPNPGSSGSARWNILAAWGSVIANGGSDSDAKAYLTKFFKNTVALPDSSRDATTAFEQGNGDVLLSYENEAILARQSGANFDYFVPDQSILIQNPAAVTKNASPTAKALLKFQESKKGQTDYAQTGFRPLYPSIHVPVKGANDPNNPFPQPKTLLTIDKDFGGWDAAATKFFDEKSGIVTKIMASTGTS
jgi:sulfate transport system substrate-binding protein